MLNFTCIQQQLRPLTIPPVSQHTSQYATDKHQQPADQYQSSGQQVDPSRAVAPSAPGQPLYSTATLMPGQQQHPPLQYSHYYGSDPTQSLRQTSMAAPQSPLQNTFSGYIANTGYAPTSSGAMSYGSGAVAASRAKSHTYVNLCSYSPLEQYRGQYQDYPHNHQNPQTNQPNPQYPTTSQGYQPNQQHPQMNQGYQGIQGYPQANRGYPQNQHFPPASQPYKVPNQQMQPCGQDQGYPNNQCQPSSRQPYNPPNQGQAGGDHIQGAGVRRQDSSPPHRPRVGSQGTYSAQGPSPQGPYGGSAVDVPPEVRQVQGHPPPVAAPQSGRRSVKSQPSPPMNQRAYPDQPHQPAQPNQRDQLDQLVLPDQTGQPAQANQIAQTNQAGQPNQLAQQNQPDPPDQPAEPGQRTKEDTTVLENLLLQGIDDDIHQAVEEVQKEEDENEAFLSEVPFDPNLVCPLCMKQFREGEIQKYRRHVGQCQGQ